MQMSRRRRVGFFGEIVRNRYLYLLTLPGIAYFVIFHYLPMVGVYYAFVDFNARAPFFGLGSPFVGFDKFRFFFTSNDWILITVNTLYLNALFIITGLLVQVTLAVAINEIGSSVFKRFAQTFVFLPNFLSWTVISVFSLAIFASDGGLLNNIITSFGFEGINFYQTAAVWPFMLVVIRIWKGAGFGTVIYLSAISGISQEMYEAAAIDGANRLQRIMRITVPQLRSTMVMLFILAVGGIFYGDFGMIFALVGDNPLLRSTTDVIDTYVYRALRMNNDISMSAAVGLFQSAVGFIMVISANAITKKLDEASALF